MQVCQADVNEDNDDRADQSTLQLCWAGAGRHVRRFAGQAE